jgi:uncharacterized protein (DUF433 family)
VNRKTFNQLSVQEQPAYTIAEAAGYLRLPKSTLRAWLLGQGNFRPVLDIADRASRHLSFLNLVEAFVLAGIRRHYGVPLQNVRKALGYLRRHFNARHPLADVQFETDGVHLFVRKLGELEGASQEGQRLMESMLRERLAMVRRDPDGIPQKIVLFPSQRKGADVVIDPRISFGRPVLDRLGVRTEVLADRFRAGESIGELAEDYSVPPEAVQDAIRCELLAA